jgi:LuxR family transcriptional regulator, maltose regulon positive regulatory protein
VSDVSAQVGQPRHSGTAAAFDLLASKLRRPATRLGTVRRVSLIERLRRGDAHPVVSVVAPAGYGKTTLLSQWAERADMACAWVSVDEADNDPKVLLSYIAEALDRVEPVDERVFDALSLPVSSVPGSVVPRLASAFSSMPSPIALVLDDVHVLHDPRCRAALSVLADHVPDGSRLVLAGRARPPLPTARLRAGSRIMEIGPDDLSLTAQEAASLLRNAEVALSEDEVAELYRRTEGWPAGLYLAALHLKEGGSLPGAVVSFARADRFINDYVEWEFLGRISRRRRAFLTRTAVLERMSGPLCEAVLGQPGSRATLADLARSNLLLVPLDRQGKWYRYHHLFRDLLLAELERQEPALTPVLRRRAADWCLANDLPEEALEYFIAAEDVDKVAGLVGMLMVPAYRQGRVTTVQRWFGWLQERNGSERHPIVAVLAALLAALTARPADAERWADVVDRWQYGDPARPADPNAEAWAAAVRAMLCRHGVRQMRADADDAVRRFATAGIVAPLPALTRGIAQVLCGDLDGGDASLAAAARMGPGAGGPEVLPIALCERALVAIARGERSRAEALAGQVRTALRQARIEDSYAALLVGAVQARVALQRGDIPAARRELVDAQRLRPLLTYALPHIALQARIELARVHLALTDTAGARTLMREADELLLHRPGLGTLVSEADALRADLAQQPESTVPGASSLTAAELRLLPLLSTRLPVAEIAEEMLVPRRTIRSRAVSIYRKLGVASRGQAVSRARELGLLEE